MKELSTRDVLDRWFDRAEWVNSDSVPPSLSRIQVLIDGQHPIAVLVTSVADGDRERSVAATVDLIMSAHSAGFICSPICLSFRPEAEQQLRSDLGLAIYKKLLGDTASLPDDLDQLRDFTSRALSTIDRKHAVIAGGKRVGCLNEKGEFRNSFRTNKCTPLLLRRYLSCLSGKTYSILDYSIERSGVWSRAAWDHRGCEPGVLYGGANTWREHAPPFQFDSFELE